MKFFIDSADVKTIKELTKSGLVDGVTTNPSLIAKSGGDFEDTIMDICGIIDGPVSAEVVATDTGGMIREGKGLARIAKNVCIKVPLTWSGLEATRALRAEGYMVNVTLCFSANQALLAAKAGASFISPFVGRLDDIGIDGMALIADIRTIYDHYETITTEILVASVRNVAHVHQAGLIGADVATLPPDVLKSLVAHPLTEKGLADFLADWKTSGKRI